MRGQTVTTIVEEIAAIRKILKAKAPTLSVRGNRGTAYGWVGIRGSGEHGMFTEAENAALKALGLSPGGNYCVISPDSRAFWLKRWTGKGEGRRCGFCSAEATGSFFCPCDLTHWTCDAHKAITDCARLGEPPAPTPAVLQSAPFADWAKRAVVITGGKATIPA